MICIDNLNGTASRILILKGIFALDISEKLIFEKYFWSRLNDRMRLSSERVSRCIEYILIKAIMRRHNERLIAGIAGGYFDVKKSNTRRSVMTDSNFL